MSKAFGESKLRNGLGEFFANSERTAGINVKLQEAELELLRPISIVLTELVVAGALAVTMSKTGVVRAASPSDLVSQENKNRIVLMDNTPMITGGDGGNGDDDPKITFPKVHSETESKNAESASEFTLSFGSFTGVEEQYGLGSVGSVIPDVTESKLNTEMYQQVSVQLQRLGYDPDLAIISHLNVNSDATREAKKEGRAPRVGMREGSLFFISVVDPKKPEGEPDIFVIGAKNEKGELQAIQPNASQFVMGATIPVENGFAIPASENNGGQVKILEVTGGIASHAKVGLVVPDDNTQNTDEVITAISFSEPGIAAVDSSETGVFAGATPVAKETVTTPRGLELTIGSPITGQEGAFLIENMKNGKDLVALNGDVELGFKPEDNQWVYIKEGSENYRVVLQRASDGALIGELKPSGNISWDWNNIVDENGVNILFEGGKKYDVKNLNATLSEQGNMLEQALLKVPKIEGEVRIPRYYMYSSDRTKVVVLSFLQIGDNPQAGYVMLKGAGRKPPIVLWVENFDLSLPQSY